MDEKRGAAEASHWFRNQPARRLASFVRPMQEAMRASAIEAETAIWLPLMSEGYASLLVLHPVRPVEPIADYVFKGDRINKNAGILRPRDAEAVQLRHADAPLLIPEKREPVPWAVDDLTHFLLNRNAADTALDMPPGLPLGAVLGVLEADAARLWPALQLNAERAAVTAADVDSSSSVAVVEPEGGKWPHSKGMVWSDAEREAMFLMRHRDKVSDDRLTEITGATRQTINQLIGPSRGTSAGLAGIVAKRKGCKDWAPSAALLSQCGAPLQPLQNVVARLAG